MNKIFVILNRETSYVYHMLSVARCGYDNAYGEKYRCLHSAGDLEVLKRYENLISVNGGAHCGRLYWYLVARPACGQIAAPQYYSAFSALFAEHNSEPPLIPDAKYIIPELTDLKSAVLDICAVMIQNYSLFERNVWPEVRRDIEAYNLPLMELFEKSRFTERAELAVGCTLESHRFYAVMTNSTSDGPEAIDISSDRDVFGIDRPAEMNYQFIAHEFIIYLLKSALRGTSAFLDPHHWGITEALAEFYLRTILEETCLYSRHVDWIHRFDSMQQQKPDISARELYLAAVRE